MVSNMQNGCVKPIGMDPPKNRTMHGVVVGTPGVKWKWYLGDSTPSVDVFNTLQLKGHVWRIRYPEEAPASARYELIVDDSPQLTIEQYELVREEKKNLVRIWEREKKVQDKLLSLWVPGPGREGEAIAKCDRSRYLEYTQTIYLSGAPFNLGLEVIVKYTDDSITRTATFTCSQKAREPYEVKAQVYIKDGDHYINLDSIKLPIVDGKACSDPLVEYLRDNPLMGAGRALAKVGKAIKKAGQS